MKVRYIAVLAALAAAPAFGADDHMHGMDHAAMSQGAEMVDATGTVNTVNAAEGVINVTHAPIAALGWPAMTMDFRLEPKALAAKLKPNQAVKFKIKKVGQTDYVVTAIEPAK